MTALTRRAALATTARAALAVAAGSGVAVAVLPDDDQPLHALAADLKAALAAQEAAGAACSAASHRYEAALPERPTSKEHIAAWKAECDRLYEGFRAVEGEFDARVSAVSDLALRIAQAPAATLAGVRIKLSLKDVEDGSLLGINGEQGETLAEDLVISIAADLDRLASV